MSEVEYEYMPVRRRKGAHINDPWEPITTNRPDPIYFNESSVKRVVGQQRKYDEQIRQQYLDRGSVSEAAKWEYDYDIQRRILGEWHSFDVQL